MDEPTTALDVVTQRQILEKIEELRSQFGFATVFITHDLSLLLDIADSIAIMYAGRMVEIGPARAMYSSSAHPYSRGLLQSFPRSPGRGASSPASRASHPTCAHCHRAALSRRAASTQWTSAGRPTRPSSSLSRNRRAVATSQRAGSTRSSPERSHVRP